MHRHLLALALALASCGPAATPASAVMAPTPAPPGVIAATCATPEHRQFDFWLGDWDVLVRARTTPDGPWDEARGTQHIEAILGGCAIAERFAAEGPGPAWAGRSYSVWQPQLGQWRQTWVDDQGSYLAFTGGVDQGAMTLIGEPRERDGKRILMRMVFLDVTPASIRWEWQRQVDGGAWDAQMVITYRRRARA